MQKITQVFVFFVVCLLLLLLLFVSPYTVKTEGFEQKLKAGSHLFLTPFVAVDKSLNHLLCAFVLSSVKWE